MNLQAFCLKYVSHFMNNIYDLICSSNLPYCYTILCQYPPGGWARNFKIHAIFIIQFLSAVISSPDLETYTQITINIWNCEPSWISQTFNVRRLFLCDRWTSAREYRGRHESCKMNPSESQQNLLANEARAPSVQSLNPPSDYSLGPVEKHFLLSAERGDCATVKR